MIASVRGRVVDLQPDAAVVEVGGVGLLVSCTPATLAGLRTGEPARLATALVVREDSLTLYGFADDDERTLFELLQSASGVGPRLAQAVLAVHPPSIVRRAIAGEDLATLTRVPGIGRKGAQRIVLELKDRIGADGTAGTADTGSPSPAGTAAPLWSEQLRAALTGLGWSAREAEDAVVAVTPEAEEFGEPDLAALLRSALRGAGVRATAR
ncbi:MAG: Holliday junction branch migration protein RuvA [Actinomycetota bacterium]|nr:Holliday junction branch migration protein RuvA [Actinomycetota bacterium]